MRPDQRDAAYLWDMLDAARHAVEFTRDKTQADFLGDRLLQYAVERAVEIRNVLAHEYGDVDPSMMWDLAQRYLPALIRQLEGLIPSAERKEDTPTS